MKEDIAFGIKNALEKGDKLEDAINSFINAGYNANDVREAAQSISSNSAMAMVNSKSPQNGPQYSQSAQQNNQLLSKQNNSFQQNKSQQERQWPVAETQNEIPSLAVQPVQVQPKSHKLKVIVLVAVLIVLSAALASVIFFSDSLTSFFG